MARGKYKDIVRLLADQIRSGAMRPGQRMPTHRDLAYKHGLSLGTATRVYSELFQLGLISGEVGRGTFVRAPVATQASSFSYDREAPSVVDLSRNFMILEEQTKHFAAAVSEIVKLVDEELLNYQPHAGCAADRVIGASWLADTFGGKFAVDAGQVIICSGGQHALTISLMAITQPGDIVAVESFTYPGLRVIAGALRLDLAPVEMDAYGILPDSLESLCQTQRIKALYCMPTVQNPLGLVMPMSRRREIADIARRYKLFIIEDDAYGFLVKDAPAPLASLLPEQSFYLRTVSKSLAPGLRVAYLVAPDSQLARLTVIVRATTWTASPLMIGVASRWISEGIADHLIVEKRKEAAFRHKMACQLLVGYKGRAHAGSFHLWLNLPPGCRTDDFLVAARGRNVLVSPASLFMVGDPQAGARHAVRLCLGAPRHRSDLERALRLLAEILDQRANGLLGAV